MRIYIKFFLTLLFIFFVLQLDGCNSKPKNSCSSITTCWFLAEFGNVNSQVELVHKYVVTHRKSDQLKAFRWAMKAAKTGNKKAEADLGQMYFLGIGTQHDYVKAATWFLKAANQGDAIAQAYLGYMYWCGDKGVPLDFSKSFIWLSKSAKQNNAFAQSMLAGLYLSGAGVKRNYTKAFSWFMKSAQQGEANAQGNLAYMYYNGYGVSRNYILAYVWANLALANNNAYLHNAITNKAGIKIIYNVRTQLYELLTPQQRENANKITENYWKKYSKKK